MNKLNVIKVLQQLLKSALFQPGFYIFNPRVLESTLNRDLRPESCRRPRVSFEGGLLCTRGVFSSNCNFLYIRQFVFKRSEVTTKCSLTRDSVLVTVTLTDANQEGAIFVLGGEQQRLRFPTVYVPVVPPAQRRRGRDDGREGVDGEREGKEETDMKNASHVKPYKNKSTHVTPGQSDRRSRAVPPVCPDKPPVFTLSYQRGRVRAARCSGFTETSSNSSSNRFVNQSLMMLWEKHITAHY